MSKANAAKSKTTSSEGAASQAASQPAEKKPVRTSPPNHIFIGKKPVMSYAMSALIQLAQTGEVVLKARGMVISRAVDVAEIITKRLGNNAYEVKSIVIDTERVGEGENARNVSTIEIKVGRKQ
jgi:DNA-binding protein